MLHRKQKICWEFTGKSPNGKVVKSLYLKIAYMWTRPEGAYTLSPIFLYFWVGGIFPLKKYFQRNSMEFFLSICIFSTSIEPIWFDSEKIETKRNGLKTLPRLNFLPSLGKKFCSLFSTFSVFSDFFSFFSVFFKKRWNEMKNLPMLGYYRASGQYLYRHS